MARAALVFLRYSLAPLHGLEKSRSGYRGICLERSVLNRENEF